MTANLNSTNKSSTTGNQTSTLSSHSPAFIPGSSTEKTSTLSSLSPTRISTTNSQTTSSSSVKRTEVLFKNDKVFHPPKLAKRDQRNFSIKNQNDTAVLIAQITCNAQPSRDQSREIISKIRNCPLTKALNIISE